MLSRYLLAFRAPSMVQISDARLGCLYHFLNSLVLGFLISQLLVSQKYVENNADTTVLVRPFVAVADSGEAEVSRINQIYDKLCDEERCENVPFENMWQSTPRNGLYIPTVKQNMTILSTRPWSERKTACSEYYGAENPCEGGVVVGETCSCARESRSFVRYVERLSFGFHSRLLRDDSDPVEVETFVVFNSKQASEYIHFAKGTTPMLSIPRLFEGLSLSMGGSACSDQCESPRANGLFVDVSIEYFSHNQMFSVYPNLNFPRNMDLVSVVLIRGVERFQAAAEFAYAKPGYEYAKSNGIDVNFHEGKETKVGHPSFYRVFSEITQSIVLLVVSSVFTSFVAMFCLGKTSQIYDSILTEKLSLLQVVARYAAHSLIVDIVYKQLDSDCNGLTRCELFTSIMNLVDGRLTETQVVNVVEMLFAAGDKENENGTKNTDSDWDPSSTSVLDKAEFLDLTSDGRITFDLLSTLSSRDVQAIEKYKNKPLRTASIQRALRKAGRSSKRIMRHIASSDRVRPEQVSQRRGFEMRVDIPADTSDKNNTTLHLTDIAGSTPQASAAVVSTAIDPENTPIRKSSREQRRLSKKASKETLRWISSESSLGATQKRK